jgi:hypothetical protein
MSTGNGRVSGRLAGTSAVFTMPQACEMFRIPAGEGLGGLNPRVMIGAKALTSAGK